MREQDLARIAFVTRRFGELQGLRLACLGTMLLAGAVTGTLLPKGYSEPLFYIVLPAQNAMFALNVVLNGYYERCFGRVPSNGRAPHSVSRPQWDHGGGIFVVWLAMSIDLLKSMFYPGGVSLAAVALASLSAWIVWRDWPHRMHHVLGVAAGVIGLVISSSLSVSSRTLGEEMDPGVAALYAITYAIVGLGLLAVGLLDHRLLAQAMTRNATCRPSMPDRSASRLRASVSATCLLITASYLLFSGWPADALGMYMSLYLGLSVVMIGLGAGYLAVIAIRDYRSAERNRIALTEARLLAQMASIRSQKPRPEIEVPAQILDVPPFDLLGHFVLPVAIACGALVDTTTRGAGFPSLLALAFAASHLRIALRDWPTRRYYLLGAVAGSISAVHFMFVSQSQVLDWTVWFLILTCSAMLVEGLLDYRLATKSGNDCARETDAVAG